MKFLISKNNNIMNFLKEINYHRSYCESFIALKLLLESKLSIACEFILIYGNLRCLALSN